MADTQDMDLDLDMDMDMDMDFDLDSTEQSDDLDLGDDMDLGGDFDLGAGSDMDMDDSSMDLGVADEPGMEEDGVDMSDLEQELGLGVDDIPGASDEHIDDIDAQDLDSELASLNEDLVLDESLEVSEASTSTDDLDLGMDDMGMPDLDADGLSEDMGSPGMMDDMDLSSEDSADMDDELGLDDDLAGISDELGDDLSVDEEMDTDLGDDLGPDLSDDLGDDIGGDVEEEFDEPPTLPQDTLVDLSEHEMSLHEESSPSLLENDLDEDLPLDAEDMDFGETAEEVAGATDLGMDDDLSDTGDIGDALDDPMAESLDEPDMDLGGDDLDEPAMDLGDDELDESAMDLGDDDLDEQAMDLGGDDFDESTMGLDDQGGFGEPDESDLYEEETIEEITDFATPDPTEFGNDFEEPSFDEPEALTEDLMEDLSEPELPTPATGRSTSMGIDLSDAPVQEAPAPGLQGETLVNSSLLYKIPHQIKVEIGRANLSGEDLTRINYGSIIELDRKSGDPVDLILNGQVIAQGEVVKINEDQLGVRVTRIEL